MARHYWAMNRGENTLTGIVTTGTSSTGEDVEISTLDGQSLTKEDIRLLGERILNFIQSEDASAPFVV